MLAAAIITLLIGLALFLAGLHRTDSQHNDMRFVVGWVMVFCGASVGAVGVILLIVWLVT